MFLKRSLYSGRVVAILTHIKPLEPFYQTVKNIYSYQRNLSDELKMKKCKTHFTKTNAIITILPTLNGNVINSDQVYEIDQLLVPIKFFLNRDVKNYQYVIPVSMNVGADGSKTAYYISIHTPGRIYINKDLLGDKELLAGTLLAIQTNDTYNQVSRKAIGKMILEKHKNMNKKSPLVLPGKRPTASPSYRK